MRFPVGIVLALFVAAPALAADAPPARRHPQLDAIAAVDQCRRGNTAAGIPVLEKKLRDGLFSLPRR